MSYSSSTLFLIIGLFTGFELGHYNPNHVAKADEPQDAHANDMMRFRCVDHEGKVVFNKVLHSICIYADSTGPVRSCLMESQWEGKQ